MRSYQFATLAGLLVAVSAPAMAQEAAAFGSKVQEDSSAIQMQVDARNAALMSVLNKLTTCNAKQAFYMPSGATADADGCVKADINTDEYEIAETRETRVIGDGNDGPGGRDTETIDMRPFINAKEVTVRAVCTPCAWGDGGVGELVIPSMSVDVPTTRIFTYNYRKANYINAEYDATTKRVTLTSGYGGDSTNNSRSRISDMSISFTRVGLVRVSATTP